MCQQSFNKQAKFIQQHLVQARVLEVGGRTLLGLHMKSPARKVGDNGRIFLTMRTGDLARPCRLQKQVGTFVSLSSGCRLGL